jgi:hypothetical protein
MEAGVIALAPTTGAPDGWVVKTYEMPIACPDDLNPAFYVVLPEAATEPLPVAVVFHSGAFDFVEGADPSDPLAGTPLQDPIRLTRSFALRRVFMTLGMYPDDDSFENHDGAIATALAEQGVAMIIPGNCWGDLWHNQSGETDNDIQGDGFQRNGRAAAIWAWRMATEPGFWPQNYLEAPAAFAADQTYMVGLGDGSRAVGELLGKGYTPTSLLVDSPTDDLRTYMAEQTLYGQQIKGLNRIFPGGADSMVPGSLFSAPTYPARSAFIYSSVDPQVPAGANSAVLANLGGQAEAWVYDAAVSKHVFTGEDLATARQGVAWMLDADPFEGDTGDTGS